MQFLSIGANNKCADDILEFITNELQQFKNDNMDYSIDKVNINGTESIICKINDDKDQTQGKKLSRQAYRALMLNVSNALADYIMRSYEEKITKRIVNSNYFYFSQSERKDILKAAFKVIRNEDKSFLNTLLQIRRRNIIVKKLMDYFDSSNSIILDGFVNFRLKDYIKDLEEIVEKAVDNFLMEKEYKEFIKLLKYFVDIQEPKFYNVHIVVDENSQYTLLDEKKQEITNECIKEYMNEISGGEINHDDLLVSSLITLAPKKVTIHNIENFKNKELLETIKSIFHGNITICKGCGLCKLDTAIKKEN
ncbi:MAG: putative sporulation protein YtxC [Firmicutes bacterium]|nr:putative sporulation protein YtxC [Bacillota bacterium]